MRAVTLAQPEIIELLNEEFVCSWKNIEGLPYAGKSNKHLPEYGASEVETCAGHNNVQMFFLTADGKVVHCLPGYWNPQSFLAEAQLAVDLNKIYLNERSPLKRNDQFTDAHLSQILKHDQKTHSKSQLTGFDSHVVRANSKSDFNRKEGATNNLKSTLQIVHERMAERPYLPFNSFNIPTFIDMGLQDYSYHFGIPAKTTKTSKKKSSRN